MIEEVGPYLEVLIVEGGKLVRVWDWVDEWTLLVDGSLRFVG